MKLGIYEKFLHSQIALPVKLTAAKEAGFEFLDIAIDETQELIDRLDWSLHERIALRNAILNTGVPVYGIVLSAHRKYPLGSASKETRRKARQILEKTIQLAVDIGARVIQLAGYYVFYERSSDLAEQWFLEGLHWGVHLSSEAGIMLGLENMDGRDVTSITQARKIVDRVGSPWLQLYPDLGNISANGLDVCTELAAGKGHFVGIHLKDTRPGEYRRVPFGDGIVPFGEAFRTLYALDYHGPFSLEMWNDDWPNVAETISSSRKWMLNRLIESGFSD